MSHGKRWKSWWDDIREDVNTLAAVGSLGIAGLGLFSAGTVAKRLLYPGARPVDRIFTRLKGSVQPPTRPVVRFDLNPYSHLTPDKSVILQGRNKEGKTTLLKDSIHWHKRWGPFAYHGLYLNGSEGQGVDSFAQWQTSQMFGSTTTGGSEIAYTLVHFRQSQWLRLMLETLKFPVQPKPAFIIVDQFEELLKRYPQQALDWANTLTNKHVRDNLARVIFVTNSDDGSQTLLNLNQGDRFEHLVMEPASGDRVSGLDLKVYDVCQQNIGLYKVIQTRLRSQRLPEEDVEAEAKRTIQRWKEDFHVPYVMKYARSWTDLPSVAVIKEKLEETLEQELREAQTAHGEPAYTEDEVQTWIALAKRTVKPLEKQQILDSTEEVWKEMLESVGAETPVAKKLARAIRRIIGYPVPGPNREASNSAESAAGDGKA